MQKSSKRTDAVGAGARDAEYLAAPGWAAVVTAAAGLAQVLVANDHVALSKLHEAGYRWPLDTEPSSPEPEEGAR
ncbi:MULTISPECIES: hypothetical protein [Streptomyces]|uniref:hypothetical protein n=1 Tax=Streptomyces TaxID=1883 RepID=UPI000A728992|nr:hypothetical protein [Streptomyces virginiae]